MKSLNLDVETLHEDRVVYLNGNGNVRTFSVWDLIDIFYDNQRRVTKNKSRSQQ